MWWSCGLGQGVLTLLLVEIMVMMVMMKMQTVMKMRETRKGTPGYIGVESFYLERAHDILQKYVVEATRESLR